MASWRATANGLEAIAAAYNDQVLVLDELGQATPADLEAAAHLLGNGTGKARTSRDIATRPSLQRRLLLHASGEVGLAAELGEAGTWRFCVLPERWRAEVRKGLDPARVARLLAGHGLRSSIVASGAAP